MMMSCNIRSCHRCHFVTFVTRALLLPSFRGVRSTNPESLDSGSCFAPSGMTRRTWEAVMAGDSGKKLFVGPRFRRIRQQLGLSQTQMAEGLGISPSYINLIERNQRPVTAQILLRLAEAYDLDLRDLATADEDRFFAELNEIFSDPLFRQIDL